MIIKEVFDNAILNDVAGAVVTRYEAAKDAVIVLVNSITDTDEDPGYEIVVTIEVYDTTDLKAQYKIREVSAVKQRIATLNMLHTDSVDYVLPNYVDLESAGFTPVTDELMFKHLWLSKI